VLQAASGVAGTGRGILKSVPTAAAAIRGDHPGTGGEVYGVVGVSDSAQGAGLGAANTAGGPDLVLDGSGHGAVDTLLSEGSIDRPSETDQTFLMENSGSGRLDVDVDGDLSATTVTGELIYVTNGLVIDTEGNWQGNGDTIPCLECVDTWDIADLSITSADLADSSVTTTKIAAGAVQKGHLAAGAVTSAKIAANAVGTTHIADGQVSTADLADSSVTGAKIANGAVDYPEIANGAIRSVQILDGMVFNQDLANDAVTGAKIADGTITSADVDPTGSIYVSKNQLYVNTAEVIIDIVAGAPAIAACNDANDLPLAGGCRTSSVAMEVCDFELLNWASPTLAAEYDCKFFNKVEYANTGTAMIACISVPGS
jgi:hypothetical protein